MTTPTVNRREAIGRIVSLQVDDRACSCGCDRTTPRPDVALINLAREQVKAAITERPATPADLATLVYALVDRVFDLETELAALRERYNREHQDTR